MPIVKDDSSTMTNLSIYGRNLAWQTDTEQFVRKEGRSVKDKIPLITFRDLEKFVEQGNESTHRILIGAKGTGKTSALHKKANNFALDSECNVIPRITPNVFLLTNVAIDLDKDKVGMYCKSHIWEKIWTVVIASIYAYHLYKDYKDIKHEVNLNKLDVVQLFTKNLEYNSKRQRKEDIYFSYVYKTIENCRGRGDFLTPLIAKLMNLKVSLQEAMEWYTDYLRPAMCADWPNLKTTGIFIDAIEETFADLLNNTELDEFGSLLPDIWKSVQCGIIDSSRTLQSDSAEKLLVYASIQSEAYKTYNTASFREPSQLNSLCLEMRYDKEQLREIFINNIINTEDDYLIYPTKKKDNPIEAFFGVEYVEHPYVWGKREEILDWIIRHTFGIPRQVVWHGLEIILKMRHSNRSDRAELSHRINTLATLIFTSYIERLQPKWEPQINHLFKLLESNVIPRRKKDEILYKYRKVYDFPKGESDPLTYLYARGLLGCIEQRKRKVNQTETYLQKFLPPGISTNNTTLPYSNYYVVHPCLNGLIVKARNDKYKISEYLIAGHGNECPRDYTAKILIINNDGEIKLSYHNEGIDIDDDDAIESNRLFDLENVKSSASPILILSILLAIRYSGNGVVNTDQVCRQVEELLKKGLISTEGGLGDDRLPINKHIRKMLDQELARGIENPFLVRQGKTLISKNIENSSLKISSSEEGNTYQVLGIKPSDIFVRL